MSPLLLLMIAQACRGPCDQGFARASDGNCYPYDATAQGEDSGAPWPEDLAWGDPIELVGADQESMQVEWMDAVVLDDAYALMVGQGGYAVVDMGTGDVLSRQDTERGYRVALDTSTQTAWVATRVRGLYALDVRDPANPQPLTRTEVVDGYEEDIAADGGLVLVGAQEAGARVLDAGGRPLSEIPADFAFGVALEGDRALVADGATLGLWDLTDPMSPQPLDRVSLPATGRDIAWSGRHVAVALGGSGVEVLTIEDDRLSPRATLEVPGSAFSVAIDGALLWIGAWDVVALAWLGGEEVVVLGHEEPAHSAMAVDARGGLAAVADWGYATVLRAVPGRAGPEIDLDDRILMPVDGSPLTVPIANWGAMDLELELEPGPGLELSERALTLSPGERATLTLSLPQGGASQLLWQSNDPDEPGGSARVEAARQSLGEPHEDFELASFTWPDTTTRPWRLSDQLGQVVFLAYWTTW